MRRVMIIGQPGAGKSTLAREVAEIAHLPVIHVDHIHWQSGWRERSRAEKTRLCEDAHARPAWVFEGGHSATWPDRLARADTLIWLDLSVALRLWRVGKRTLRWYGRTRPDLPEGCPEQFSAPLYLANSAYRPRQLRPPFRPRHRAPRNASPAHPRPSARLPGRFAPRGGGRQSGHQPPLMGCVQAGLSAGRGEEARARWA